MLPLPISAVRAARPNLTPLTRAVLDAVLLSHGSIGTAQAVARRLGLGSRFKLARLLRREGLPSLHQLAEWITVLSWVVAAEQTGASLCWMAFRSHRHPSACYRLVKEVTGLGWEQVRERGSSWVQTQLLKLLRRIDRPATGPRTGK